MPKNTSFEQFREQYGIKSEIESFTPAKISNVLVPHISTGIPQLDALLGGGLSAGTIMLGGHSGMGKSTLALQIAQNISAQGIPVFYYSLEMSKAGIAAKALARQIFRRTGGTMSIASSDLLYEGSVSGFGEAVWKEIEAARSDVAKECRELFVIENRKKAPISGYRIYQDGVKYAEKAHAVVFVDYLQVLDLEEAENAARGGIVDPRSAIERNLRWLRQLADEMQIPVVIINSLNRGSYGKSVGASAFKESGAIEYSADVVLAMQFGIFSGQEDLKNGELLADREKSKNPRVVDVIALKQRYGCSGEDAIVRFHYYAGSDCFQAIANQAPLAAPAKKRRRKSAEKETVSAAQPAEPNPDYDTDWMKECE